MAIMALELQMSDKDFTMAGLKDFAKFLDDSIGRLPSPHQSATRPATIWTLEPAAHHYRGPVHSDKINRSKVLLTLKPPCAWCGATGNEFMSMYSECPICGGTGISPVKGLLVARTKSRAPAGSMLREFNDFCGRMLRNDINRMFGVTT